MAAKMHVKKGDDVVVITGAERGSRGKVLAVLPDRERVVVEGIRIVTRHTRKSQRNQQGGIVKREGTMHASNVMLASRFDERVARRPAAPPAEPAEPTA